MSVYHFVLWGAFSICMITCAYHFIQIVIIKKPHDHAKPRGKTGTAIRYAFTGAMSPFKKETARGHLPTYTAGILYHVGTFISFFLLLLHFCSIQITDVVSRVLAAIVALSALCGALILLKRVISPRLRAFSNADDYASNLLVSGFQVLSVCALLNPALLPTLFIYASALLLYIPLGKLKHTVYFFASRIYLGIFFGTRGVWPLRGK